MKKINFWMFTAMLIISSTSVMTSCSSDDTPESEPTVKPTTVINYKFATKAEAQQLMQGNTVHYATMTQNDIDWRMRKEQATIEEFKAFAQEQALDFSDTEKAAISRSVAIVQDSLNAIGCHLPVFDNIVFIRTTMKEEGNPFAYTIKNQIFIGGDRLAKYIKETETTEGLKFFNRVIAHELFHCITRNSPDFRQKMYSLIGFTVMDHDIVFPESVTSMILQNPDVEHIDNYAEFTIDGQKRRCELVALYTETFAEAYAKKGEQASFFKSNETVLIPLDEPTKKYKTNDIPEFWTKVGRNTDYVLAPEECMADNFSFAVAYGMNKDYQTPELIRKIINTLKTFK